MGGLAELEMMRRHYAAAAEMLERAIEMDKRARRLSALAPKYLSLAEARIGQGRPEAAQAIATQLREGDEQSNTLADVVDAEVALDRGEQEKAIAALEDVARATDLWLARLMLGNAYFQAERYPEALAEFESLQRRSAEAAGMFEAAPTARYLAALDYFTAAARNEAITGR
jgi:tetratricopeptide (TPR) repeat protein